MPATASRPMATAPLSVEPLETADGSEPLVVRIATLPTAALPGCMYHLLELVFFAQAEPQFLSVSVLDGSTLTLIAEAEPLDALAAVTPELQIDEIQWNVVRVGEGSLGFESIGVVERLVQPLANASIPVLYLSTYSTDYCLLPRERREEALDCLLPSALPPGGDAAAAPPSPHTHTHPLTVLDAAPSHVVRLDKRHRQRHTGALLRLLFMPQRGDSPQAIASLTETADEISLMSGMNTVWWEEYVRSAEDVQHDSQEWVPIRVGGADGTPLSEIGVVATQAKILADADISILYLSTFFSDFTLVQRADVDRAAAAFEEAGFECMRQSQSID